MRNRFCINNTHALKRCLNFAVVFLYCLSVRAAETTSPDEALLWNALRSGEHIGLIRHALAPGTGDPENFTLGDCSTQRNLSEVGRDQAKRIGERFRANGISSTKVYTSQWCRCIETSELLALDEITELPVLNSFFQREERRVPQTAALNEWLAKQTLNEPLILVTHQVNISALTSVYTRSGEMVVLKRSEDGTYSVAGTIKTD